MKILNISLLSLLLFSTVSCFEDKGNYDYKEKAVIEITSETEIYSVLRAIEPVVINTKIKSSLDGDIMEGNPNVEFSYSINIKDEETSYAWTKISEGKLNFNQPLDYQAGKYLLWFQMKDKRTGIISSKTYTVMIMSATYEGWMILGTEGAENKTRLDMISVITPTREELNFDIMKTRGLPEDTRGAQCLGWFPNNMNSMMDRMFIFPEKDGYMLEKEEFSTSERYSINYVDFVIPTMLVDPVASYTFFGTNIIVTTSGDAYAQAISGSGPKFLDPINILKRGDRPEFKVSPYIGHNAVRPTITSGLAVLFDVTNRRFMGFNGSTPEVLFPLINGAEDNKFNFDIKMDLIYMAGTGFDGGIALALLKDDAGRYNIAGMNIKGKVSQHTYVENIVAPELANAKYYAFHSKYPILFYAVGNKVYFYNWAAGTSSGAPIITLDSDVTMLKFQLYGNESKLPKYDDPLFVEQQYNLLVATHNGSENGGTLGFYKTSDVDYSVSKVKEYTGFCKIKDVIYRERR